MITIIKTEKRKENTTPYAKLTFTPSAIDSSKDTVEKDLFF
jgi:hypothetical protein